MTKGNGVAVGSVIAAAVVVLAAVGFIMIKNSQTEEEIIVPPDAAEQDVSEKVYLNILDDTEPGSITRIEMNGQTLTLEKKEFSSAEDDLAPDVYDYEAELDFEAWEKVWMILRKYNVYFHLDDNENYAIYYDDEDGLSRKKLAEDEDEFYRLRLPLAHLAEALNGYASGRDTDAVLQERLDAILTEEMINI